MKFLCVNTGNDKRPAFSAFSSVLVVLGFYWQTKGACSAATSLHVNACKCQFAVSSLTFLHLRVHNHTMADEPENNSFFALFQHLYTILPSSWLSWTCPLHLHNFALNPIYPFPCRIISKRTSAEYIMPF